MKQLNKGVIYLLLSGICYAIMSVFIRLLDAEIPVFSQIFLRYIVAASVAFTFARITKTKLKMKNIGDYLIMVFIAIFGYCFSSLFFTLAILNTDIASAVFIFSTTAIITPILGFLLLAEKISRITFFAAILSLLGIYLLSGPTKINNLAGSSFALIGAILNASYLIGSRRLRKYSAKTLLVYSTFGGVTSLGLISFLFERNFYTPGFIQSIFSVSAISWIVVLIFGLDNFLAWLFLNKGLQTIKAGASSVILLIEPILASILGIIFYKELPQITSILGMIIISTGIILATKERNEI